MWERTKAGARLTFAVLKQAGKSFGEDRASRMAAAVAYRTMFALAPLLLLAIYVLGLVAEGDARIEILDSVEEVAGGTVKQAVDQFLDSVSTSGNTAGLVGFALLIWTGSSLFLEVQNDLNDIFGVPYDHTTGLVKNLRKRGLAFLWATGLGLVLVFVWLLNGIWQYIGEFLPESFGPAHRVIAVLTPVVSVIVLPFVFALTFQVLSQAKLRWRAVWWGSFFTSVLFLAAAYLIGVYFRLTDDSAATAASAIFVLILLAFVLASVFLLGAEVTKTVNGLIVNGDTPDSGSSAADSEEVVTDAPSPVPTAAIFGFLGGLLVGWRRSNK